MIQSWTEIVYFSLILGLSLFLAFSLSNKMIWIVLFGISANYVLFALILSIAMLESSEIDRFSKLLLSISATLAFWAPGTIGLFAQKSRKELLKFSYSEPGSFMGGLTRWIVRSRNILLSVVIIFTLTQSGMRKDVSPIWVFSFGVVFFWPIATSPEGLGIKSHHLIRRFAPISWKRIRGTNIILILSIIFLLWGASGTSPTIDTAGAYMQLFIIVAAIGALSLWYARIYKRAADEVPSPIHATSLSLSHRYALEIG